MQASSSAMIFSLILALPLVNTVTAHAQSSHIDHGRRQLSATSGSSKHHLFQRQAGGTAAPYPALDLIGPAPQDAWVQAYNAIRSQLPNVPVARNNGGVPVYPRGVDGSVEPVCSWTSGCRSPLDITDAKDGQIALSFDDGPQGGSVPLSQFLDSVNQTVTHFLIGSRILENADSFQVLSDRGDDLAVHTWSHPLMTTMTDMQVLGEIGWTMQIIFDNTKQVPILMRPPYGDADNRVRAIAKLVFGLEMVIWNQDTDDWCLNEGRGSSCRPGDGPQSDAELDQELQTFIHMPKSPGLMILEHEITTRSVAAFVRAWPAILAQGWDPVPISESLGINWYQDTGRVAAGTSPVGKPGKAKFLNATTPASPQAQSAQNGQVIQNSTSAATNSTKASNTTSVPSGTPSQKSSAAVGPSFATQSYVLLTGIFLASVCALTL